MSLAGEQAGDRQAGDRQAGEPDSALLNALADAPYVLQSVGLVGGEDPILPTFGPYIQKSPCSQMAGLLFNNRGLWRSWRGKGG